MLILAPTAMAARAELQKQRQEMTLTQNDEEKMSLVMRKVEKTLAELQEVAADTQMFNRKEQDLLTLRDALLDLDQAVSYNFNEIGKRIKRYNLSDVIIKRHQYAVQRYRQGLNETILGIDGIEEEKVADKREQKIEQLRARVKEMKYKRSQQPFDPENLPTRLLQPKPDRKPKLKKEEFLQSGLYDTPYVKLAALGDFTYDKLTGASDPAYLAASDEVVLTQAIKDQAARTQPRPGQDLPLGQKQHPVATYLGRGTERRPYPERQTRQRHGYFQSPDRAAAGIRYTSEICPRRHRRTGGQLQELGWRLQQHRSRPQLRISRRHTDNLVNQRWSDQQDTPGTHLGGGGHRLPAIKGRQEL